MSELVILYRKTQGLDILYSDICCPLAFVYKVKYYIVCRVEQVEIFFLSKSCNFSIKSIKKTNNRRLVCSNYWAHRIIHWCKANDCFESDGLWHSTGYNFLYMDGALTLTFSMWFLHSSWAAPPLPEGYCITGASGLLGSRRSAGLDHQAEKWKKVTGAVATSCWC